MGKSNTGNHKNFQIHQEKIVLELGIYSMTIFRIGCFLLLFVSLFITSAGDNTKNNTSGFESLLQ